MLYEYDLFIYYHNFLKLIRKKTTRSSQLNSRLTLVSSYQDNIETLYLLALKVDSLFEIKAGLHLLKQHEA